MSQPGLSINDGIVLDGKTNIDYARDSKMLGLRINRYLKWSNHIQDVRTKLSNTCYALALTSSIQCSSSIIRQLYFAIISLHYQVRHRALGPIT